MTFPILPQYYISYSEETLECSLCYQPSIDLFQCKGACYKKFCHQCVSKQKMKMCIHQCSSYCLLQSLTISNIQFLCPYSPEKCKSKLNSKQSFQLHVKECQFVPESIKNQIELVKKFKCQRGHTLVFISSSNFRELFEFGGAYQVIPKLQCNNCFSIAIGRSICVQCSHQKKEKITYCCSCMPVPCQKWRCPLGHNLQKSPSRNNSVICDFCGIFSDLDKKTVYKDTNCNFDICLTCYERLPSQNKLIPLQNVVEEQYKVVRQKTYGRIGSIF